MALRLHFGEVSVTFAKRINLLRVLVIIAGLSFLLGCESISNQQEQNSKGNLATNVRFRTECSGDSSTEFEGGRIQAEENKNRNKTDNVEVTVP